MKKLFPIIAGLFLLLTFSHCNKENTIKLPFEAFEAIVNDSIESIIDNLTQDNHVLEVLPSIANQLSAIEEVEKAEVFENDIVLTFTDGRQHIIMFRLDPTEEVSEMNSDLDQIRSLAYKKQTDSESKKVIIWEAFRREWADVYNISLDSVDHYYLKNVEGIQVDTCISDQCTVGSISQLFGHDYVIINTHGAKGGKWIATHEKATEEKIEEYQNLIDQYYVSTATITTFDQTTNQCIANSSIFIISDDYIRSFNNRFDDCVIFTGYCHGMDLNSPLCKTFRELGASIYMGFVGAVSTYYAQRIGLLFTKLFCLYNYSAKQAYEYIREIIPDNPISYQQQFFYMPNYIALNQFRKDGEGDITFFDVPPVPTDGLVAYYPFNGNAEDVSGNHNNGILCGDNFPEPTTDRHNAANSAYHFGGYYNHNWIKVPNSESLMFDRELTISFWIQQSELAGMDGWGNYSTTGPGFATVCKAGDGNACYPGLYIMTGMGTDGVGLNVGTNNSNGNAHYQSNWNHNFNAYVPTYQLGDWMHICLVINNTEKALFINGVFAAQDELNKEADFTKMNQQDLYIGVMAGSRPGFGWGGGFWYPFYGKIDDIRIYNRALSKSEILALSKE